MLLEDGKHSWSTNSDFVIIRSVYPLCAPEIYAHFNSW